MAATKDIPAPAKPPQPAHGLPPATEKDVRVRVFQGHTSQVNRVAMPADGRFALTSSTDGTVRRWALAEDGAEGEIVCKGKAFWGLAVTADSSRAAAGDTEGTIRLIELSTARVLREWKGHDNAVGNVAFHAGGRELLSAAEDGYLRRWDADTGARIAQCKVPFGGLYGVAESVDGNRIVGAAFDGGLALWSGRGGAEPVIFKENVGEESPVSLPADGRFAFTGTDDGKVAKWDLTEGRRVAAFEGHSSHLRALAVTPDGRFCVSGGDDKTVRLWAAETGECLAVLRGHRNYVTGIAITPDARRIASVSNDQTLRVWDIPAPIPGRVAVSRKRGYVNAKVVLLGDSGVGKSGLAFRLWHDRWEKTESSHGIEIQRLVLPGAGDDPDVVREVWLWDLAGQPDYRLTHQLFMEQTALAVFVFDPQEPDFFATVGYWQSALSKVAQKHAVPGILTAARCDRPGLRLTMAEVREWAAARGLHGPILTAAKDSKHPGAAELRALIEKLLPWDKLEFRSTQENFPALKDAILAVREAKDPGGVVVKPGELEARVRKAAPHLTFTPEDLRAVTGLLAGEGVLHALPYGDLVVLQPSWVNCYASTLVKLAGEAENKLGHVPLERIQAGNLYEKDDRDTPRLSVEDEQQLLPALVALFLERALAWKQETSRGTMLVFPNYVRLPRPAPPPRPGRTVVYRFTGPLEEIYCTLVVRLHYSGLFSDTKLYRQASDFASATGKLAALTMRDNGEGGELDVYFGDKLDADVQAAFQQFVHDHLTAKAKSVERLRNYFCPMCKEEVTDRRAVDAAKATMKPQIFCAHCGSGISLDDVLEQQFIHKAGGANADEAGRQAGEKLNKASREQVMVGEVMALVGEADQIYRIRPEFDGGMAGEIEFRDRKKKPTGITFQVQLMSGDSHLKKRKDNTEVFAMKKHYASYWAGKGTVPVLLIIRSSDGRMRFMDATKAIHAARKKAPSKPVTQLVFTGDDFTRESLLRLRDQRLADLQKYSHMHLLELKNIGPSAAMNLELGSRINMITGDNGLGKSFLLDAAWWATTLNWVNHPALPSPSVEGAASIDADFLLSCGSGRSTSHFDRQNEIWQPTEGTSHADVLGLYSLVDGSLALHDPARIERGVPRVFHFRPEEVWNGKKEDDGVVLGGLISDFVSWQQQKGEIFEQFCKVLKHLSPNDEKLRPGTPSRISLNDVRDIPTIVMPYGQEVPVIHLSAGIKRILSLAYMLVWLWQEHRSACRIARRTPVSQIVFLIDEIESHLHPRWQRAILESLLDVMRAITGTNEVRVQLVCVTHAPLILASLEPIFHQELDRLFHLKQSGSRVSVDQVSWAKQGDVSNWLVSEIFGLKQARSRAAEKAIEAAEAWMRGDAASLAKNLDSQTKIHEALLRSLPGHDEFWPRWIVSTKSHSIKSL